MIAFVAPVAAVMVVLAPALIHVLYGAHWEPAAAALQFLAFVMVARMLTALVFDIQTGLGRTQVSVWLNLAWLLALLPALWIGVQAGGVRGAAMGHAAIALVVAIPLAGWMLHRSGIEMRPVLRRTARPILAGLASGLTMAVIAVPVSAPVAQLVLAGGLGMGVYLLLAMPLRAWATSRHWVLSYVISRRGARA
jgi:PST family polysaccharide transporter